MNPQMMQMPTEKQLWKTEPNKLRIWIILFIITLSVFTVITIVGSIMTIFDLTSWKKEVVLPLLTKITDDTERLKVWSGVTRTLVSSYIIFPLISGVLALISIIYFAVTLPKSYKENSFANLPSYPISISYLIGFIGLFNIWGWSKSISLAGTHVGPLLTIISTFFAIFLLFFAMRVGSIRKIFIRAKAFEKMQQSPEFQHMQDQMKDFFNQANNGQTPNSPFGTAPRNPGTKTTTPVPPIITESPEITELKKLTITELREIGLKLSISGSKTMPKDDLIKSIIRVTKGD